MKFAVLFLYYLGLALTVLAGTGSGSGSENELRDDNECSQVLMGAKGLRSTGKRAPKLMGHWTSVRCETRPGPEFVLRKYLFRRNKFHAQFYYYADDECTQVSHYISATGTFNVKNRPSWRTPGAFQSKYTLSKIIIIPYINEKARLFEKLLRRYCHDSKYSTIESFNKYKIYQFTKYSKNDVENNKYKKDFDCSKLFNFTMNELQLVRMAKYKVNIIHQRDGVIKKPHIDTELLLGDVSTNMKFRRQYRPTHFQDPLKRSKTVGCEVCRKITDSDHSNPPVLTKHHTTDVGVLGNWVSERCESRPNGQYLTRHLTFLSSGSGWEGVYEFYRDPLCKERHFKIDVKGTYIREGQSKVISRAANYFFTTLRLKITPLDFQMTDYLNSYDGKKCGKSKMWKVGHTQDVTDTKGCYTLGISLPNMEYELLKTDYDNRHSYLYVGQRPSDFVSMETEENRPTSFQRPLVKCGTTNEVVPEYTQVYVNDFAPQIFLNTGTKLYSYDILVTILSILIFLRTVIV